VLIARLVWQCLKIPITTRETRAGSGVDTWLGASAISAFHVVEG
jgi:hypothetical protein